MEKVSSTEVRAISLINKDKCRKYFFYFEIILVNRSFLIQQSNTDSIKKLHCRKKTALLNGC